ncbi:MAG: hypothetical protein WCI51_13660 [Lentisphaerota bacterium]
MISSEDWTTQNVIAFYGLRCFPWILKIPALSMAVLPKPPFEPVSAKMAYLASGFYFFTWILDIPCWLLDIHDFIPL